MTSAKTIRALFNLSQQLQLCEASAHADGDHETKLVAREAGLRIMERLTAIGRKQAHGEVSQ